MKRIALYFGDVFWSTLPYGGLSIYESLSKDYEVIPIFQKNDIRLHKTWRGNEKFYFDKERFLNLPYEEVDNIPEFIKKINPDLYLCSIQMQFKPNHSGKNRQIKNMGVKVGMWDCGGSDSLWCDSKQTGWDYLFIKGQKWKEAITNIGEIKKKVTVCVPPISSQDPSKIFVTGTPEYDDLNTCKTSRKDFCKKYNLDVDRPIIAYLPANPGPDNSWVYPSTRITARQALDDIGKNLRILENEGYQVCMKSHPNDYITTEIGEPYSAIHPRANRGGYKTTRYDEFGFHTIEAQDGYELYKICDFAVTNYSHAGQEIPLTGKRCLSYRMKECPEWQFLETLNESAYLDVMGGFELREAIMSANKTALEIPKEELEILIDDYYCTATGTAHENISKVIKNKILW